MIFTQTELKAYFNGKKRYAFYEEANKEANAILVHANKIYPKDLIDERRPSESEAVLAYRKKIYKSKTKGPIQKILNELMKIRKADDWSIQHNKDKVPASIKEGEDPYTYFEVEFPIFQSVTNWVFTVLLKSYITEANSVVLVMPENLNATGAELFRPFPYWFPTASVLEFKEGYGAILKSRDKHTYTENGIEFTDGEIFYVIDKNEVEKYVQISSLREFEREGDAFKHNLGYLPAFKVGGQFSRAQEGNYLFESRINACIDPLDEAAREYSDLQAEVVQHVHSEKWVLETQKCEKCNGHGKTKQGTPAELVVCTQCKGSGNVGTSPYMHMVVKRAKVGEQQWTGDPAGYIKKPTEIVEIQDRRVDKHIYSALAAVGMEFLADVPLNESGKAKEVDRDPIHTFVNSVGEDLVKNMDTIYKISIDMRYQVVVPDKKTRKELLPKCNVPTKLDILSANYLVEEINKLRTGNVNPLIVIAAEIELANKKFSTNPKLRDRVVAVFELDPLPGISDEIKMSRLQNKGITIEDYIVSCNIHQLVQTAFFQDEQFGTKKLDEQKKIILALAKPKIDDAKLKIDIAEQQQDPANPDPAKPDPANPDPKK